jgi:Domain of unknown function (DUF6438)
VTLSADIRRDPFIRQEGEGGKGVERQSGAVSPICYGVSNRGGVVDLTRRSECRRGDMKLQRIAQVALVSLVLLGCSSPSPEIERFGFSDLESRRVSGEQVVRVAGIAHGSHAEVRVVVDVEGRVMDAEVDEVHRIRGLRSLMAKGAVLAAAKDWRFKPPMFEGRPVQAVGRIVVFVSPEEILPDTRVPFPSAASSDVEITLERTGCLGPCPFYEVSVRGDGTVRFSTLKFDEPVEAAKGPFRFEAFGVLWPGEHEVRVSPRSVQELLAKFRAAHFMGLQDDYFSDVMDVAGYALDLRVGAVTKRVDDVAGRRIGMPEIVTTLQDAVDTLAGTDRWVVGNAETVELLKKQGFDFKSKEAAELVHAATQSQAWPPGQRRVGELILAALDAGLDLSRAVDVDPYGKSPTLRPIGVVAVNYAAETGNEALFSVLARRGQLSRTTPSERNAAFHSGMGCHPGIARALVAAGADPEARAEGGGALHVLTNPYGYCPDSDDAGRAAMAQTLIELGVPPDVRDDIGWTPLMKVANPALAQVLLKAGADPNAKAADGRPALMSVGDDRVALLLLRAGADPRVKYEGETLRQKARERRWPGTLAWLDAHNVP